MARRIQRELDELKKDAPETISAGPREGNLYVWDGMIIGSVATPYEGGMFKLLIQFPDGYPFCPPKIFFVFFKCLIVIFNQLLRILLFFNRVHQNFHSIIIKTFILYHIQHIEFDFKPLFRIINSEIKPLSMPL